MENIEQYLEEYRHKLEGYYSICLEYDQPKNEVKSHYNSIRICLKTGYSDADFFHELTHLKFMTEEGLIKYYYPIESYFEEMDRYAFINSLVNIVYDIYVDSYLSVTYELDKGYFENKLRIYTAFMKNADKVLKLKMDYVCLIKYAIEDYLNVLKEIVNGEKQGTYLQSFLSGNDINSQRKRIAEYLAMKGYENEFEWLTHKDIYEREQKKKREEVCKKRSVYGADE